MKIHTLISTLLVAAAALCACDNIEPSDRYIELEAVQPKRAVLIEEFTGQMCTNCPEGHAVIASLRQQYGTSVIPVSIHASRLALGGGDLGDGQQGLATDEGETYFEAAGKPDLPSAVIDRSTGAELREAWAATVRQHLAAEAPLQISLKASATTAGNLEIDVEMLSKTDLDATLQLWIVENGIKSLQNDNGNYIIDYTHNHVFRASANGTNGTPVELKKGVYLTQNFSAPIAPLWKVANLAVVAFVHTPAGVLQAAEALVEQQ